MAFLAEADDRLEEVATGKKIRSTNEEFAEKWNFVREGNEWKLDGINQPTEDVGALIGSLNKFAEDNGMYFSLDWGRLLLPKGGNLFCRVILTRPMLIITLLVFGMVAFLFSFILVCLKMVMALQMRVKIRMKLIILLVRLCCLNLTAEF